MNERWPTENVPSTCSPSAAPMNHGAARFDCGAHVFEAEALRDRRAERAVVHPQHDRHVGPVDLRQSARSEHLVQHDAGLDVDHVVLGQHRDRAGFVDAGGFQRLAQRGVAEDHRHVEFGAAVDR